MGCTSKESEQGDKDCLARLSLVFNKSCTYKFCDKTLNCFILAAYFIFTFSSPKNYAFSLTCLSDTMIRGSNYASCLYLRETNPPSEIIFLCCILMVVLSIMAIAGEHRSTGKQEHRSTAVQEHMTTGVQEQTSAGAQMYWTTGIQDYGST